jgi:hypothetical protein
MPRVAAFHSVKQNTPNVHHDNSECTEGNNIESQYKRAGTWESPRQSATLRTRSAVADSQRRS